MIKKLLNYDGKGGIRIGGLSVTASRFPWQPGYNWRGAIGSTAPLNPADKRGVSGRFGGGWRFCIGVRVGGTTTLVELGIGMLRIVWRSAKERAAEARRDAEFKAWQARERAKRAAQDAGAAGDIPF